jgi:hypothetical protein
MDAYVVDASPKTLVDRDAVGVAGGDPPLALLAAKDMSDAQGSTGTPLPELAMCSKPTS